MDSSLIAEIVGYTGSAIVILSLTMKSILRLRMIGLVGNVTFLAYGILIDSIPIVLTNIVIISIQAFFIRRLLGAREVFSILRTRPDAAYLHRFLDFHAAQIERFQPGFTYQAPPDAVTVFILRDMLPAGLVIGLPQPDGSMEVSLDHVIPQYRDFKLGRFVYSERSGLLDDAFPEVLWSRPWSPKHEQYLIRMGFEPSERAGEKVFELVRNTG